MTEINNKLKYNKFVSELSDSQKSRMAHILLRSYNTQHSVILNNSLWIYDKLEDLTKIEHTLDIDMNATHTKTFISDILAFVISRRLYKECEAIQHILYPYNDGNECKGSDFVNVPIPILLMILKELGVRFKVLPNILIHVNKISIAEFAYLDYKPAENEGVTYLL